MSNRPTPPHHKTVRVPLASVARGYGGSRSIAGLKGLWDIVAAHPTDGTGDDADHFAWVIVAPARGPS